MSYPINYPTPQGANFQAFYGSSKSIFGGFTRDWVKPQGASMVRMLLIGAGGNGADTDSVAGAGGAGGGSGAVTSWIGPAMFVPNILRIQVGRGGGDPSNDGASYISYQGPKDSDGYSLIWANGGNSASGASQGSGASAFVYSSFGASGIVNTIAGQSGAAAGNGVSASLTTFLSGGAGGSMATNSVGLNVGTKYGYPAVTGGAGTTGGAGRDGYFLFQPILIGQGGAGGGGSSTGAGGNGGNGGIGCGGGGAGLCFGGSSLGGKGGDGAVFIWSW